MNAGNAARERRWLVLGEDGRHVWLGRDRDPEEAEIERAAEALRAQQAAGWLAVSEGVYYSDDAMRLLQVRDLNGPTVTWEHAVEAFHRRRSEAS